MAEEQRIRELPEDVVNRVAAGEVLQRPSSALKELVENALDAHASRVSIVCNEGGNKLLQVQDNGKGIHSSDLPLLCTRYATSKLRRFDDLPYTQSFGFRGEALASMSFAGRVTVTTMRSDDPHAVSVTYRNGCMESSPSPCAGVPGTTVSVEDIFVTMPARKRALRSAQEEYASVLAVVQRYACLHYGVAFTCRKHGSTRADLNLHASASRIERLSAVYGTRLVNELMHFSIPDNTANEEHLTFSCEALVSKPSCENKRSTFTFFVNGRPVACNPLRKAIDAAYNTAVPKQVKPFAMLFLRLPAEDVDVNVHPSKEEVHFLYQEEIGDHVNSSIERKLLESNASRSFNQRRMTNTLQPAPVSIQNTRYCKDANNDRNHGATSLGVHEKDMDRSDPKARRLDAYFHRINNQSSMPNGQNNEQYDGSHEAPIIQASDASLRQQCCGWHEPELVSVDELIQEAATCAHSGLLELFSEHTFVGMADGTYALVQHRTKLYMVSLPVLTQELMRQQAVRGLGQFRRLQLSEAVPIHDAIRLALEDAEKAGTRNESMHGPIGATTSSFAQSLCKRRELLRDCFAIDIDANGNLCSLPVLVERYTPGIERIPELLLGIACDVDWTSEKECFAAIANKLGEAYSVGPFLSFERRNVSTVAEENVEGSMSEHEGNTPDDEWLLKHVIFPAIKKYLLPPKSFAVDGYVMQVASLERLYKIFERC